MRIGSKLVGIFLLLSLSTGGCAQNDSISATTKKSERVVIITTASAKHKFNVELADSDKERMVGLMYRTEMAADAGMLFNFEETQPISMWMKNTLIPLDMAFIDEAGVIKRIAPQTTPRSLESIPSGSPALAVLEVNGGTFERLNIKEGDIAVHPIFKSE